MGIASIHRVGSTTPTTQRSRFAGALAFAVVAASFGASLSARADTYANNGGNNLTLSSSWIDLTNPGNTGVAAPGAADIASFDSNANLAAATIYTLGSPTTWGGILVQNPGNAVTIDFGQNPLTLGASGIDMSAAAQNLTLAPTVLTIGAAQNWNVVTGRTLTVNSTVALGSNILTLQGAGGTVFQNVISGAGGLAVSGAVVTLGGTGNSYSGGTTLNSGTLNINTNTAIGTGSFVINGGTINNTSGIAGNLTNGNTQTWNGNFTFTGGAAMDLGNGAVALGANVTVTTTAGILTEEGVISGAFGLGKSGAGTLTLTAANAFTGAVTINAGVLNFNAIGALGASNAINLNGGSLQYGGTPDDISVRTVTLSANSTIDTNGLTVTFANSIGNGGTGGFAKGGTGTLTLAASDNYSGATTVTGSNATNASVLVFPTLASLGTGTAINLNNGTLMYGAGITPDLTARTVTVSGTLSAIDLNGNSVTYANKINGTGTLTLADSSATPVTVTLSPSDAFSGVDPQQWRHVEHGDCEYVAQHDGRDAQHGQHPQFEWGDDGSDGRVGRRRGSGA